jgi:hypothetical protein
MRTKVAAVVRRNAIALVALFVALGGVAYAGSLAPNNSVDSSAIVNGQVKSKDARDNGIKGKDVQNNGIEGKDVKNGSLALADLGPTVSGSFNLGPLAGGSCASSLEIFDVAGADDGDMWLVTPTGGAGFPEANYDLNGALTMVGIPHTGEGHIKVCNESGGQIDPDTVNYTAVLING